MSYNNIEFPFGIKVFLNLKIFEKKMYYKKYWESLVNKNFKKKKTKEKM